MSDTPNDPRWPSQPPEHPDIQADADDDDDDFDESTYDLTGKRRFLGGKRLVAVAIGVVVLVGAGAAFALTGGDEGGDDDETTTGEDGRGNAMGDAAFEYAECMRENGIEDFPDPVVEANGEGVSIGMDDSGDGADPEDPEFAEADEACRSIMEDAMADNAPDLTPEELAERQDQALAMAQCMRDRGWDFPDPEVDEGGGIGVRVEPGGNMPEPGDPDADQFQQDQQECDEEAGLPGPEGGEGGGGQGPSTNSGGGEG